MKLNGPQKGSHQSYVYRSRHKTVRAVPELNTQGGAAWAGDMFRFIVSVVVFFSIIQVVVSISYWWMVQGWEICAAPTPPPGYLILEHPKSYMHQMVRVAIRNNQSCAIHSLIVSLRSNCCEALEGAIIMQRSRSNGYLQP